MVKDDQIPENKQHFHDIFLEDLMQIKKSTKAIVRGDTLFKIYKINPDACKNVMNDEITKFYKKIPEDHFDSMNAEARDIGTVLQINDGMEKYQRSAHLNITTKTGQNIGY